MIDSKHYSLLLSQHFSFFTGVPDSLLKGLCASLTTHLPPRQHIIAGNEGSAVALAAGHFLATGNPAVVYMQNSGIGNALNPLLSLADPMVFGIPMLILVGWRGEPGVKDEPQHARQGIATLPLLDAAEIAHELHCENLPDAEKQLSSAILYMMENHVPYALVVKKGTFSDDLYSVEHAEGDVDLPSRENAIETILDCLQGEEIIISTTGMASRELFELREKRGENHRTDFLTVGSMGHASQIASAIALSNADKKVICIDGDGAALMHLGGLASIGSLGTDLMHIVINNGAHDSVGGQPTIARQIDLCGIAKACGYTHAERAHHLLSLRELVQRNLHTAGPVLIEALVRTGAREDLGRPTQTPQENKNSLMEMLSE